MLIWDFDFQLGDQTRIRPQNLENLRSEATANVVANQFGLLNVRVTGSTRQIYRILQFPDSIVDQPLKEYSMAALSRSGIAENLPARRNGRTASFSFGVSGQ
ncbi:MAG: hypothetical protein KDA96_08190 [Planctomycetaceae bacterium]|nr:hypothetical protein [Planctomycetaceae bacterium]